MMDDPLAGLAEGLAARNQAQGQSASGVARIKQDFDDWLYTVAASAFGKIKETVEASGATTQDEEAEVNGSERLGVSVYRPGSPKASYVLYLHPNTGTARAFVMKRVHEFDADASSSAGRRPMKTEAYPFFDENTDARTNDARWITEDDIIRDFTEYYLAHRDRWG